MSPSGAPPSEIRGLVLPTGPADLLLPNAAVAEIVAYYASTPVSRAPDWLLGTLTWRDRSVPLVSVAAAGRGEGKVVRGQRSRLVVCFTLGGNVQLPYVAILAVGPPRLARLNAEALVPAESGADNPFIAHELLFEDRRAWIPDMDAIERSLLESLQP